MMQDAGTNVPQKPNEEILKLIEEFEAPFKALLEKEWVVGVNDKGMGRYSYAVITVDEERVVKCDHEIIARHISQIHNASINL